MDVSIDKGFRATPHRVLVADGDVNVRSALRLLLTRHAEFSVTGVSGDVEDVLHIAALMQPDVILLDWELRGLHTAGRLAQLRSTCPSAAIIALSTHDEARPRVLEAGLAGFVGKSEAPDYLLAALRASL